MNERIKELAMEHGYVRWSQDNVCYELTGDVSEFYSFAELIVQKCVTIVALHGISNFENEDISWVCEKIVKEINEHFGVKE